MMTKKEAAKLTGGRMAEVRWRVGAATSAASGPGRLATEKGVGKPIPVVGARYSRPSPETGGLPEGRGSARSEPDLACGPS